MRESRVFVYCFAVLVWSLMGVIEGSGVWTYGIIKVDVLTDVLKWQGDRNLWWTEFSDADFVNYYMNKFCSKS